MSKRINLKCPPHLYELIPGQPMPQRGYKVIYPKYRCEYCGHITTIRKKISRGSSYKGVKL